VTIPATVPQGSEIPEGLMNNPVYIYVCVCVCVCVTIKFLRTLKITDK